jgi:hypothetical protein
MPDERTRDGVGTEPGGSGFSLTNGVQFSEVRANEVYASHVRALLVEMPDEADV